MNPSASAHPGHVRRRQPQASRRAPRRATPAAAIAGVASAFPRSVDQAEAWETFFAAHYGNAKGARALWHRCGVQTRHHAVDPRVERDLPSWGTEKRMLRFQEEASALSLGAARSAIADAGLEPRSIRRLTVVSCTGYGLPGVDMHLVRELGLSREVERLHVGHMGCGGAVPGLATTADAVATRRQPGLLVCVELPSLHIQPAQRDLEQALTHALFSDAASAVAVVPERNGLEIVDRIAITDADSAEMARLTITDRGFVMGISPFVPRVLERHLTHTVATILSRNELELDDVSAWAVHPGGPAVLGVVQEQLALSDESMLPSREVLRDHGNCSSATVLLVLEEVRRRFTLARDELVMLLAFSPGITLHAVLLRQT